MLKCFFFRKALIVWIFVVVFYTLFKLFIFVKVSYDLYGNNNVLLLIEGKCLTGWRKKFWVRQRFKIFKNSCFLDRLTFHVFRYRVKIDGVSSINNAHLWRHVVIYLLARLWILYWFYFFRTFFWKSIGMLQFRLKKVQELCQIDATAYLSTQFRFAKACHNLQHITYSTSP
jgi:hypothetical protein